MTRIGFSKLRLTPEGLRRWRLLSTNLTRKNENMKTENLSSEKVTANGVNPLLAACTFFLCSQEVIDAFPECEHSKPFKSGYNFDYEDNYYVALLDFEKVEKYYKENIEPKESTEDYNDFWCRECEAGQMDVSKITLSAARFHGLFVEIEKQTGLTKENNRAMSIYNLSQKFNCTPIELINKIVR